LSDPLLHIGPRAALPAGGHELLGRVDRGDVLCPDPARQLRGEPARAAADVEHPHALLHAYLVGQRAGERDRVPPHEAVVVLCPRDELRHQARADSSSRISFGSMNRTSSSTVRSSETSSAPRSRKNSTSASTSSSGALAPDVMPTVCPPSSHSSRTWVWLSIRWEAAPCSRATSTRRLEFEELVDPITNTRSHSLASCLTAIWRFVVA